MVLYSYVVVLLGALSLLIVKCWYGIVVPSDGKVSCCVSIAQ